MTRLALLVVAGAVVIPARGHAQVIYPNVPPPPVTLDPGAPPVTTAPVPDRPPAAPSVVVVSPDGKVTTPGQDKTEPTGTYVRDSGSPGADQPSVIQGSAVPELHVVRRGDTLWDICFLYFNDPWQWPKIWSYNPQVTNPHWIYPGDLVRLLPRGMFAQATAQPKSTAAATPAPVDALPPPRRRLEVGIKQTAFVEKSDLEKSITIAQVTRHEHSSAAACLCYFVRLLRAFFVCVFSPKRRDRSASGSRSPSRERKRR